MMGFIDRRGRGWQLNLGIGLLAVCPALGAANGHEVTYRTAAEQLLSAARLAEEAGDSARQFNFLRQAVRVEPENELARWQLGQIKVGDEWVAIEDTQRQAASDPKQVQYRELRAKYGETAGDQLTLARWCRKNGLEDEARFHWASVLGQEPNEREALRALDMRWHDGELKTQDDIEEVKQERIESRRTNRHWKSRVYRWQRILVRDRDTEAQAEALDEIRDITDVGAIPAMEIVTLKPVVDEEPGFVGLEKMGLAFATALGSIDAQLATESLVRHAVQSPSLAVRTAATDELCERPVYDFVPLLLNGLAMPIESSFRVTTSDDGSVHYLHSLYREGAENDWQHQTTRAAFLRASNRRIAARLADDMSQGTMAANARETGRGVATAQNFAARFGQEAMAAEQQVAAVNQSAAALNARIVLVLRAVTGRDLGSEPRAWWDWWRDENGYYQNGRPVYETNDATYAQYSVPQLPPSGGSCECFAAGTLVWTKTGQQAIESLEIGDLVLAQDVNTGELAYKPVLGRTVRPPSPLLRFAIGRERLVATQGHPLWMPGVGWRMAKQLGDGAILHGVTGPMRIESVEDAAPVETYNLVVADFNTYFVGESGILAHDNTPRRPTRARVPGLAVKAK